MSAAHGAVVSAEHVGLDDVVPEDVNGDGMVLAR